jgi:2-polyprenyl-6-methoxyphenol hydroxylase-like FAD-dependent oxidoreductase
LWTSGAFSVQQHASERARSGQVVSLGDSVGNHHPNLGGGATTAAVPHLDALKRLIAALDGGVPRHKAIARYEREVLAATDYWGALTISEYFPELPEDLVVHHYWMALRAWRRRKIEDPWAELERRLAAEFSAIAPTRQVDAER